MTGSAFLDSVVAVLAAVGAGHIVGEVGRILQARAAARRIRERYEARMRARRWGTRPDGRPN